MLCLITVPILTKTEAVVLITRRLRKRKVSRSRAHQATRASHPGGAVCLSASRRIRSIVLACQGSRNFTQRRIAMAEVENFRLGTKGMRFTMLLE